ncbi:MAG: hypothetical protein ACRD5B_13535, partial [Nitrososphaeraceae archaeon]
MGGSVYSVQSKNTRAKAYEYYSNIMAYPQRYREVYGNIKEKSRSSDTLEVEMLLWLSFPGEKTSDSVQVTATYT